MNKIVAVLLWALMSAVVILLITLPINLQTQLIAGIRAWSDHDGAEAAQAGRHLAADRARLRHRDRAALRLLAHHQHAAADQPAGELHSRLPALSGRDVQRHDAGAQPVRRRHAAAAAPVARREAEDDDLPTVDVFIPTYNEDADLLANTHGGGQGHGLSGRQAARSGCSTTAAPCRSATPTRSPTPARPRRRHQRAAAALRRPRRQLPDARAQRARQGRQPQQRAGAFDRRADRRLRRRPRAGARLPARRRSAISTRTRSCSSSRRRTSSSIPTRSSAICAPSRRCRRENEMFYGIIQRGLDKWNAAFFCGSAAVLRREALDETGRLQRRQHHRGLRDGARAAFARLEQHLCRQAADRRPAAGDLRQLHRPAQPLGAGHDADPALPLSAAEARPDACRSASATCRRRCSGCSRSRARSSCSRRSSTCSSTCRSSPPRAASSSPTRSAYMIVNLMMQNYLYGAFRWPWISELYEYVQTVHLLPAVVSVILNPRKPTFKVTAKDESIAVSRLSEISTPFFVIFARAAGRRRRDRLPRLRRALQGRRHAGRRRLEPAQPDHGRLRARASSPSAASAPRPGASRSAAAANSGIGDNWVAGHDRGRLGPRRPRPARRPRMPRSSPIDSGTPRSASSPMARRERGRPAGRGPQHRAGSATSIAVGCRYDADRGRRTTAWSPT